MARRSYAGAAARAPLTIGVDNVSLGLTTGGLVNWPDGTGGPFAISIDRDTEFEEKCLAASSDGTNIVLLQRGYDGTTAQPHSVGAVVEHVYTAVDANEANRHVNAVGGEHGIGPLSAFVGTLDTQTLENKTIDGGLNTLQNIPIGAMPGLDAEITGKAQPLVDAETLARQNADTNEVTNRNAAIASAISAHTAAADPHPQYQTQAEDDARYFRQANDLSEISGSPAAARANLGLGTAATQNTTAFDASGAATAAVAAHAAASAPHAAAGYKKTISGTSAVVFFNTPGGTGVGPQAIDWSAAGSSGVPNVVCSITNAPSGSQYCVPRIINKTSTGGQLYGYNVGTTNQTATIAVDWIASE